MMKQWSANYTLKGCRNHMRFLFYLGYFVCKCNIYSELYSRPTEDERNVNKENEEKITKENRVSISIQFVPKFDSR